MKCRETDCQLSHHRTRLPRSVSERSIDNTGVLAELLHVVAADLRAGARRDARAANGGNTDMTAALLVMHSMLDARIPAAAAAAAGGQQRPDVAVHGNYKRYYGYRWGGGAGEDRRLQVRITLQRECHPLATLSVLPAAPWPAFE